MISGIQNTSASSTQLANQSQRPPTEDIGQGQGEEYQQKARSKGVPESVIKQGKQAAMKWLTENKQIANSTDSSTESVPTSQKGTTGKPETVLDIFA